MPAASVPRRQRATGLRGLAQIVFGRHASSRLAIIGGTLTILLIFVGIFGPALAAGDPTAMSLSDRLKGPAFGRWAGTDQLGRDVWTRMLYAAQVTILISLVATVFSTGLGIGLGMISGYAGGWFDMVLMRIADVQLAFPTILLAIAMVALFGTSIPILVLVFVVAGWVRYVRVIRAQVLVLKQMQYVEAARCLGQSHGGILLRHVLPNLLTEIIILMNLEIGRIVLLESSLSYLGLGVQPPMPTWGNMLNEGRVHIATSWWLVTFPGLAIMAIVLGVNLLAEGLRGLYDPRSRK